MIFVVCIFGRPNWKPNFEANPKIESWNFITHDHFPNPILIIRFFLRENGVARHLDYYCIDIKEKRSFQFCFIWNKTLWGLNTVLENPRKSIIQHWKSGSSGQTVLPDTVLIGRKWVEKARIKKKSNATFLVVFKHCVPKEDFSMNLSN